MINRVTAMHDQVGQGSARTMATLDDGQVVCGATWRDRDGNECSVAGIVCRLEQRDARLRAHGWPGHAGGRWNYFKDDVRAWWRRMCTR